MLKRIISAILLAATICTGIVLPTSAEESVRDYRYLNMVELGLISDVEDENYIMTRGEFASIICNMFDMTEATAYDYAVGFTDLDANDSDYDSIKKVVALNLFSGFPDLTFRSEEPVTVEQALKVLVSAAGFSDEAEARGGFPNGYTAVAKNIGLMKKSGISAYNTNIKRKELGILLFNLMITKVNEITSIGGETVYYAQGEETFAEKYLNLKYITDIMEANDYTNISATVSSVGEDNVIIDGEEFKQKQHSDRFYVGRFVSVFYDEETLEIASICERFSDEEEVQISAIDVTAIEDGRITAETDGKSKSYNIPSDAMIIYNDGFVMSYDFTKLRSDRDYRITLLDNDSSGEYDIVFIEDYTTIVVLGKTAKRALVDKLTNTSVNVDDTGDRKILLYDSSENMVTLDDIAENTIATVIENSNYVRAYISKSVSEDTVIGADTEGDYTLISCSANEYYATAQLDLWLASNSILGQQVKVYTDIFGNAAYISIIGESLIKYGYLVNARIVEEDALPKTLLKIFTSQGEMITFETTEKFKVNGTTYRVDKMSDVPVDISTAGPIGYVLSDDKVKKIETPSDYLADNEDGFFKGASIRGLNMAPSTKTFGGVIEASPNTVAFVLPEDREDYEKYQVKIGNTYESRTYDVDAYYKSKESETADIIVITSDMNTLTYDDPIAVIVKVISEYYKDEIYKKITYLQAGTERIAYAKSEDLPVVDSLGKGDAVRIRVDAASSEVLNISHLYDYDNDRYMLASNPSVRDFNDGIRIGFGYAARIFSGRLRVSPTPIFTSDSSVFALEQHKLSLYDILVVDSTNGGPDIYSGKEADIDIGNKVLYVTRGGGGKALVIYK